MEKNDFMPKLDLMRDKGQIDPTTLEHMKIMEKQNLARVSFLKNRKRRANLLSLGLAACVVGTYIYSMYAVRQESFLDDFEEPKLKSKD